MSSVNPLNPKTESMIHAWTREFADTQSIAPDSLQELEGHLIDSLQSLMKQGLSEEEAFLIATTRIGTADDLAVEYAKSGESTLWVNRVLWMCLGYLAISLSFRVVVTLSQVAALSATTLSASPVTLAVVSQAVVVCGFIAIWCGMWRLARRTRGLTTRMTNRRLVTAVASIALISMILSMASQLAMSRLIAISDFGQFALMASYAQVAAPLLIPVAIAILAAMLRSKVSLQAKVS